MGRVKTNIKLMCAISFPRNLSNSHILPMLCGYIPAQVGSSQQAAHTLAGRKEEVLAQKYRRKGNQVGICVYFYAFRC